DGGARVVAATYCATGMGIYARGGHGGRRLSGTARSAVRAGDGASRVGAVQRTGRGGGVDGLSAEAGLVVAIGARDPGRNGALTARTATLTPTIISSRSPAAFVQLAVVIPGPARSERRCRPQEVALPCTASNSRLVECSELTGRPELASSALTWHSVCSPRQEA